MIAPKKMSKKEKKKLSKSLWESTQNIIDPKDIEVEMKYHQKESTVPIHNINNQLE